jgi:putative metalloprotease
MDARSLIAGQVLGRYCLLLVVGLSLIITGCEDTDYRLAAEAGIDAVKAISLSEDEIRLLSRKAAREADQTHRVAPAENPYCKRLERLVGPHQQASGRSFSYKVYLEPRVNAFAMADGTIRVYSGLMDLMNDQELLFVIGHEMGHVLEEHVKEKMIVALLGSALRKGVASQQNIVGELARSSLGGFLERFVSARFSQEEEKAADDHALAFMQRHGYDPFQAVSALNKLAGLGKNHSFLSSHPAPGERAKRLLDRLENPEAPEGTGLIQGIWKTIQSAMAWIKNLLRERLSFSPGNSGIS